MEVLFLLLSIILLGFSLWRFHKGRAGALLFLILSAFCIRVTFALLDQILNSWDESFHAVVAKNFTRHWFLPTLYDDPLIRITTVWTECNLWLHKQPLFLWQMAVSIKLFGTSVFAARFPSVIMSAIQVYFIYFIGKKAVSEKVGYYSALLYAFAYFPLALVSGVASNDHNDLAFVFYICASVWAWFKYTEHKQWKWAMVIGLFSGMAILVKWLPGLLVFSGWGLTILFNKEDRKDMGNYLKLIISVMICCLVFLPWQFYIFKMYPLLAEYEYELVSKHFTEVVELHGGPWYFYFQTMKYLYPLYKDIGSIIIAISIVLLYLRIKNVNYRIFVFSCLIITYLFFSIAATKMITFTFIASPFIFLALGNAMNLALEKLDEYGYKRIQYLLVFLVMILFFNIPQHFKDHFDNSRRELAKEYKRMIKELDERFKDKEVVFFNVGFLDANELMYFTDLKVYTVIPLPEHLEKIFALNKTPVIIGGENLPDYILNDKRIIIESDFRLPPH